MKTLTGECKVMMFATALAVVCSAGATEYFVDDVNGLDSNAGTSESPLKSIQAAVEKAKSGDVITVRPGIYDDVEANKLSWGKSRVFLVNKGKLTIRSTGGKDVTHIVGRRHSDDSIFGPDAVRCISVYEYNGDSTAAVTIEGFTIRDGATCAEASEAGGTNANATRGGALCCDRLKNVVLVDCVVSNCDAAASCVGYYGTFLRCRITGNFISSTAGTMINLANLINCVIDGNYAPQNGILVNNSKLVNCTLAVNHMSSAHYSESTIAYNSIIVESGVRNSATWTACVSGEMYPVMSTATGDFRVRDGSAAATAGDAAYLADTDVFPLLEGLDRFKDFYGNPIPEEGTIAAGASQTKVTPAAGGIYLGATIAKSIDGGGLIHKKCYIFPDAYPTQYVFKAHQSGKRPVVYAFGQVIPDFGVLSRFPDADDAVRLMPPPSTDMVLTNVTVYMSEEIVYADPGADPDVADGSTDKPYATLQDAVDNTPSHSLIIAKEGVYREGGKRIVNSSEDPAAKSIIARVGVDSGVRRIISAAGAGKTVIEGAPDPDSPDGFGTNAVCCLYVGTHVGLQGFTLTGGYSGKGDIYRNGKGGAFHTSGWDCNLFDCIISNNTGYACGAGYQGRLIRCTVTDNVSPNGPVLYSPLLISCAIGPGNSVPAGTSHVDGPYKMYGCSLTGDPSTSLFGASQSSVRINCAVANGGLAATASGATAGCVFDGFGAYGDLSGFVKADPGFADPDGGDLRAVNHSPVFEAGVAADDPSAGNWWMAITSDITGAPLRFRDGKIPAGAYHTPVMNALYVSDDQGLVLTGADAGCNHEGTYRNVSIMAGDSTRPVVGVTVNGVTNLFESTEEGSITFTDADVGGAGGMMVNAVYSNEWFVDGVNGDDANHGYYPKDAKKTLASILSVDGIASGDTVKALPGTYDSGEMFQSEDAEIPSRAVLPEGVRLESTGGREVTFIKGEASDVEDTYPSDITKAENGLGVNAVRCVYLNKGSSLKGFTVLDGHTRAVTADGTASHGNADQNGGGAYSAGGTAGYPVVEDCLFSGCAAYRGGGAFRVTAVNCIFDGNLSLYGGGASSDSYHHGCLSKNNVCEFIYDSTKDGFFYYYGIEGCTAADALGTAANANSTLINTLVLGDMTKGDMPSTSIKNCAFNTDALSPATISALDGAVGSVLATAEELAVDAEFRPLIGANAAIDAGDASLRERPRDLDLSGSQRIYNGALDIGAFEADWRGTYAEDLGPARLAVVQASSGVQETSGRTVAVPAGETLAATVRGVDGRMTVCRVKVSIGGTGTLTVEKDGETLAVIAGPVQETDIPFAGRFASSDLLFSFVSGSEGDFAELHGISAGIGTMISIR